MKFFSNVIQAEGLFYSLSLLGIIVLSVVVFSYNLDLDFTEDEYQVIGAAYSFQQTGDFFLWDWIEKRPVSPELGRSSTEYYTRAWPHTLMIALVYSLFGVSEVSSRALSVLFAIILVVTSYYFAKFFVGRKEVGLVLAISLVFSSTIIGIAQYTRMYALLAPLFMFFTWTAYRAITEKSIQSSRGGILGFMEHNCNFHYGYLALTIGLLALNSAIHINSMILLPAAFLFILYLAFTSRERRHVILAIAGAIVALILIIYSRMYHGLEEYAEWFTPFLMRNTEYFNFVTGYPFGGCGLFLIFAGLAASFLVQDKEIRNRRIYLYLLVALTLFFFILVADRYAHINYASHVMPIALLLILDPFCFVVTRIRRRIGQCVIYILFAGWIVYQFDAEFSSVYGNNNDRAQFSAAYATIIDNFKPDQDVIFAQYIREYYLKDLAPGTRIIDMLNLKQYTLEQFRKDCSMEKSGFIVWASRKRSHLPEDLMEYIDDHFQHLHGWGVDYTKVEVYYFEN